jgi:acyl carrier protein
VAEGQLARLQSQEELLEVLRPKVAGTRVLLDLLAEGEAPEFILLFSSLLGSLGTAAQLGSTAASLYLDTEARRLGRSARSPVQVISWDGWAEGSGPGISPQDGLETFSRLLAAGLPQASVSPDDLQARLTSRLPQELSSGEDVEGAEEVERFRRPDLIGEYVAPRDDTEATIAAIWGELLGIDQVGVDDNFLELGGDSLLGLQLLGRLRKRLGADLSPQDLFEWPTVAGLAGRLAAESEELDDSLLADLLEDIEEMSDSEVEKAIAGQDPS